MVMGNKNKANKSRQRLIKETRCPLCHTSDDVLSVERTNNGLIITCKSCGVSII